MRRENFTLTTANLEADAPDEPTLVLEYEGSADDLAAHIGDADEIDATFRLQDPVDVDDAGGVFGLSRRTTGEYLLEANTTGPAIRRLVDAAGEADGHYRIEIRWPAGEPIVRSKETLLFFDVEGNLLRGHSLIPSGVPL